MKNKNLMFLMILLGAMVFLASCTQELDTEVHKEEEKQVEIEEEKDNPARVEDFVEIPESHYIGYITKSTYEDLIYIDKIEFLGFDDEERLRELNIDPNTLDNGYYIHNPNSDLEELELSENTEYKILNWEDLSNHKDITHSEFMDFLDGENPYNSTEYLLFHVYIKGGNVIKFEEQYIP